MNKKAFVFGEVRAIPKNVEETRTVPFVISDPSKDRHGTVLSSSGWELNAYNRNGIVGYMHNVMGGGMFAEPDPDFVIARGVASMENQLLIGNTTFEPAAINPLAEKVFRKVLFGSLKSTSVGFLELEPGKYGADNQGIGRPDETYYYGRRELIEYSIVNIPSNRNAQVRQMRDQAAGVVGYVRQMLGNKFSLSQIENMRICDVVALMEGKDLEIKSTNPDQIRRLLSELSAKKDQIQRLQRALTLFKHN